MSFTINQPTTIQGSFEKSGQGLTITATGPSITWQIFDSSGNTTNQDNSASPSIVAGDVLKVSGMAYANVVGSSTSGVWSYVFTGSESVINLYTQVSVTFASDGSGKASGSIDGSGLYDSQGNAVGVITITDGQAITVPQGSSTSGVNAQPKQFYKLDSWSPTLPDTLEQDGTYTASFKFSTTYIIAIAGGAVGVFLILVLIIFAVRRK
jgi:hypothetical protein